MLALTNPPPLLAEKTLLDTNQNFQTLDIVPYFHNGIVFINQKNGRFKV